MGDGLDIALPADGVVAVRVLEKGHRQDRVVEHDRRVVLVAVHLGQHRAAFGLDLLSRDQKPRHPVGLDAQGEIEVLGRQGLEEGDLVEPGVAVPLAADGVDRAHELGVREVRARPEGHVLEEVRQTGAADVLVAGPDPVERLDADHRQLGRLEDDQREAVRESYRASPRPDRTPRRATRPPRAAPSFRSTSRAGVSSAAVSGR